MDMRDLDIKQAKMAILLLSGRREQSDTWPTIRCPSPAYEAEGRTEEA